MLNRCILLICFFCFYFSQAQYNLESGSKIQQDSLKRKEFIQHLGQGFFPTRFLDLDLRYLIKFNQYEGIRTGLGFVTNNKFSERYRINSYLVYGFRDHRFKYSIGGGFRLSKSTNTWINLAYTDDLQETGSTKFITDGRFFQFFEPRLLNIDLFHKHITKKISLEHELHNTLIFESEFATSKIEPTYAYTFNINEDSFTNFDISYTKLALNWNPFNKIINQSNNKSTIKQGYPKITLQYTKSFKDVLKSDFNFSKIDFKSIFRLGKTSKSFSEITLVSGIANGETPLTHLYHAYPNNITKETILQRFSVAGLTSFETMYFNEFFSDKFITLQFKYFLKPFEISQHFKPQVVLISRYAIGDMQHPEQHEYINFDTLNRGYTESGFELNKLFFGFGLSFTYRYGAYHLPNISDNVALKFTFNVSL
ncbi:hypothetical protein PW52_10810 [Tamlana sedimentorum]|uniref:Uncharacterized protein n=1 Tax=Neotamlana sedimentorum TaxID=1435349 RepID=A0A0D7W7R9_9FLAO|nr:DUF5686 family protein [Tamlana sedimentorum]KJD35166.1 hypothetical protein PW52_10810 [Tamlana sedimentorum]